MATRPSQRLRAIALYKELHRLGRDYEPSYDFNGKLRKLYEKNRDLKDEAEIERALSFGEYIKNETLALYSLRKYRHLKRMYPPNSTSDPPMLGTSPEFIGGEGSRLFPGGSCMANLGNAAERSSCFLFPRRWASGTLWKCLKMGGHPQAIGGGEPQLRDLTPDKYWKIRFEKLL